MTSSWKSRTFSPAQTSALSVQSRLVHCVIAHEIGHGLFQRNDVSQKLLPLINIDKDKIEKLAARIYQVEIHNINANKANPSQLSLYPNENEIRSRITLIINTTVNNWLEELGSDAIGLTLFGPAYLFSMVHLLISFQLIDNASSSHPPNRLRMRLLLLMIGALGQSKASLNCLEHLPGDLKEFVENWKDISLALDLTDPIYEIVIESVLSILDSIGETAIEVVGDKRYPEDKHETLEKLCDLLINGIPPNEVLDFNSGTFEYPGVLLILNAGWQVLIAHMESFCLFFGKEYKSNPSLFNTRLNELVLKAVELDNVRLMWHA